MTHAEEQVAFLAVRLVSLAETLGVLPKSHEGGVDRDQMDAALEAFARVGIGRAGVALRSHVASSALAGLLSDVLSAVEESPLPAYEWSAMTDVLGDDALAGLVGVSPSSVHRYKTGDRSTPDGPASRLHFLALLTADLAGSYNDFGIRRWFQRSRSALGGRSPAEILSGDWDPDDQAARQVRALAASLLSPAAS